MTKLDPILSALITTHHAVHINLLVRGWFHPPNTDWPYKMFKNSTVSLTCTVTYHMVCEWSCTSVTSSVMNSSVWSCDPTLGPCDATIESCDATFGSCDDECSWSMRQR